MSGLLALQYPLAYASVFEPLTDFEIIDMELVEEEGYIENFFPTPKDVWIDCSRTTRYDLYRNIKGVIHFSNEDPDSNLLLAVREPRAHLNIGIWRGTKRHLHLLEQCCDIIALPRNPKNEQEFRRLHYVDPGTSHKYHLYGFSNLDELRRFPVRSLSTSVPITAAVNGIDLRTRERRPQRLFPFSYDMKMSESQIALAVQNVLAIKEALQSHDRPNRVSHT